MNPVEAFLAFHDAINRHDPDKLAEMMTEDHVFIDSLGGSQQGRETMRKGWQGYFALCPDYRVSHEDVLHNGNVVAAFGAAGGTLSINGKLSAENKWTTPAAWRVVVRDGLIKEFQVYADNKPVYDILAKAAKAAPG
jgi:ketosteroid isomerase-like protein